MRELDPVRFAGYIEGLDSNDRGHGLVEYSGSFSLLKPESHYVV